MRPQRARKSGLRIHSPCCLPCGSSGRRGRLIGVRDAASGHNSRAKGKAGRARPGGGGDFNFSTANVGTSGRSSDRRSCDAKKRQTRNSDGSKRSDKLEKQEQVRRAATSANRKAGPSCLQKSSGGMAHRRAEPKGVGSRGGEGRTQSSPEGIAFRRRAAGARATETERSANNEWRWSVTSRHGCDELPWRRAPFRGPLTHPDTGQAVLFEEVPERIRSARTHHESPATSRVSRAIQSGNVHARQSLSWTPGRHVPVCWVAGATPLPRIRWLSGPYQGDQLAALIAAASYIDPGRINSLASAHSWILWLVERERPPHSRGWTMQTFPTIWRHRD